MSNALALAAVTAVLRDLLNNGVIQHDLTTAAGAVTVTSKPPDLIQTGSDEGAQLNLFLYRVTFNQGWRNAGLPSRDERGGRLTNPPLPLDLHYLLTAYGGADYVPEILLGYAMQILHETPVLSRDAIRTALAPPLQVDGTLLPPPLQALSAADLADQVEQIKISPEALGVEDLSKLWPAFQASYRLSAAYQVSVVLIESQRSTRRSLPVLQRKVYALPLKQPLISAVESAAVPSADPRITATSTLVLRGTGLQGQVTQVRLGEALVPPGALLTVADNEIRVDLAQSPGRRAGVQGVQVVHDLLLGEPATLHRGVESNVVAFVLHPVVALNNATTTATVENGAPVVVDGNPLYDATLTVSFTPDVGRQQRVQLLLYEANAPSNRPARAYSFAAPRDNGVPAGSPSTASIDIVGTRLFPGTYLMRAQVDGAESLLQQGGGVYNRPQVVIP